LTTVPKRQRVPYKSHGTVFLIEDSRTPYEKRTRSKKLGFLLTGIYIVHRNNNIGKMSEQYRPV
jgi:hypothetical protein